MRPPPHLSNAEGEVGEAEGAPSGGLETGPPEYPVPATYIKVKKMHYDLPRPVIIIGPLKEMFIDKLEQDFPDVFQRCIAEVIHCQQSEEASINQELFESWMEERKVFDARRCGSYVECTTYSSVKKICDHVSYQFKIYQKTQVTFQMLHFTLLTVAHLFLYHFFLFLFFFRTCTHF